MNNLKLRNKKREKRRKRIRAKIFGNITKPRLSVYRGNRYIYVQIIDDEKGKTLVSANIRELDKVNNKTKVQQAEMLGELIGIKAKTKGITNVVFDKSYYKFHGRVKAVAEGARKAGLKF